MKRYSLYFFIFFASFGFAQEKESTEEVFKPHHSIALFLGHTHLRQGEVDGEKKWLALPNFALDYNYLFTEKWSIGLHNDMVIENFKVEDEDNQIIERSRPIASLLAAGYKPGKHFTFEAGLGGEFAKEEDLFVTRLGVEYSVELPNEWEFLANFVYDNKWGTYDSLGLSVGVAKKFGK
ncbi:hypothetical protein [Flavobacterium sp. 5]|uniref:hypothetical protein n=1 Tax=Flavobacterium sp. 5 TaxID=2035199 RepID=UPI000C2CA42F|nr:hypothetical protein [Flavobacterium sp. 5]PKB15848.1 hypothetical protein CLU82_0949 [Flavobacterium sp. 5]